MAAAFETPQLDFEDLISIRELILDDPIAFKNWGIIKDDLVQRTVDRLRIDNKLRRDETVEAIKDTLEVWANDCGGVKLKMVKEIFMRHGLTALAEKLDKTNQTRLELTQVSETQRGQIQMREMTSNFATVVCALAEQEQAKRFLDQTRQSGTDASGTLGKISWFGKIFNLTGSRLNTKTSEGLGLDNFRKPEFDEEDKENLFQKYPYDIFPSSADLADLSSHAYENNINKIKSLRKESIYSTLGSSIDGEQMDGDWIILAAAHSKSDKYYGTTFYDKKRQHLVIVHRGTQHLSSDALHDIACDIAGLYQGKSQDRVSSAYRFTCDMINRFSSISISITTTGHSLGGWLAQLTAFYLKYPKVAEKEGVICSNLSHIKNLNQGQVYCINEDKDLEIVYRSGFCDHSEGLHESNLRAGYHIHTVSFDSPSSRTYLDRILKEYSDLYIVSVRESEYCSLDITSYIAYPLFISSCGKPQVGLVKFITSVQEEISLFKYHSINRIINALRKKPESIRDVIETPFSVSRPITTGIVHEVTEVLKSFFFDETSYDNVVFQTKIPDPNIICRITLFNDEEQAFLYQIRANLKLGEKRFASPRSFFPYVYFSEYLAIFQSFLITEGLICFNKGLDHNLRKRSDFIKYIKLLSQTRGIKSMRLKITSPMKMRPSELEAYLQFESNDYVSQIQKLASLDTVPILNNVITNFLLNLEVYSSNNCRVLGIYVNTDDKYQTSLTKLVCSSCIPYILKLGHEHNIRKYYTAEGVSITKGRVRNAKMYVIPSTTLNIIQKCTELFTFTTTANIFDIVGLVVVEIVDRDPALDLIDQIISTLNEFDKNIKDKKLVLISSNESHFERLGQMSTISVKPSDVNIKFINLSEQDQIKLFKREIEIQGKSYQVEDFLSQNDLKTFNSDTIMPLLFSSDDDKISMGNTCHFNTRSFYVERELVFSKEGSYLLNESVHENNLIELNEDIIILADEPGTGKSTTMKALFNNLLNSRVENWIVFVDLALHKHLITNDLEIETLLCAADKIQDSKLKLAIFRSFLNKNRVQLLFDGLDEIDLEKQEILLSLISKFKGGKVWIACRSFPTKLTKSNFSIKCLKFKTLTDEQCTEFLLRYWKYELENLDSNQAVNYSNINTNAYENWEEFKSLFSDFAKAVLNQRKEISNVDEMIGISLQLHMLATINTFNFLNYANAQANYEVHLEIFSENIKVIKSIRDLYKEYINIKYQISFAKLQLSNISESDWINDFVTTSLDELHSKAGFYYLFSPSQQDNDTRSFLTHLTKLAEVHDIDSLEELNRIDLICYQEGLFRPIHQTIAEYFSAIFLVNCLKKPSCKEYTIFLRYNHFESRFPLIRYFLGKELSLCSNLFPFNNQILDAIIEVQGKSYQLQNLIPADKLQDIISSDIILSLIIGEKISMGNMTHFEIPKIYIQRKFKLKVLRELTDELKAKLRSDKYKSHKFVVACNQEQISEVKNMLGENVVFMNSKDPKSQIQEFNTICETSNNVHWFDVGTISKNKVIFVWRDSVGEIPLGYQFLTDDVIDETNLIELVQNVVVLADVPGIGKSVTMKTLFNNLLKSRIDNDNVMRDWIVFVDLAVHQNLLIEGVTFERLLCGVENLLDSEFKMGIFYRLLNDKRIQVLIDGFHEIPLTKQELLLSLINRFDGGKIIIASRLDAIALIESKFHTKCIKFERLKDDERIDYLLKFWKFEFENSLKGSSTGGSSNFDDFKMLYKNFASAILDHSNGIIPYSNDLMANRLLLDMLATINTDKFLEYASLTSAVKGPLKNHNEFINIYKSRATLYREYINAKYKIGFTKHDSSGIDESSLMNNNSFTLLDDLHSKVAFYYLFSQEWQEFNDQDQGSPNIQFQTPLIELSKISDNDAQVELNRYGLVLLQEEKIHPIYQTIAEYFAAIFLANCLQNPEYINHAIAFLKYNYYEIKFDTIRYFLDNELLLRSKIINFSKGMHLDKKEGHLSKEIYVELFYGSKTGNEYTSDEIKEIEEFIQPTETDLLGRNFIHYMMIYGNHRKGILGFLLNYYKMLDLKDKLNCNCLHYSIFVMDKIYFYTWHCSILKSKSERMVVADQIKCLTWDNKMTLVMATEMSSKHYDKLRDHGNWHSKSYKFSSDKVYSLRHFADSTIDKVPWNCFLLVFSGEKAKHGLDVLVHSEARFEMGLQVHADHKRIDYNNYIILEFLKSSWFERMSRLASICKEVMEIKLTFEKRALCGRVVGGNINRTYWLEEILEITNLHNEAEGINSLNSNDIEELLNLGKAGIIVLNAYMKINDSVRNNVKDLCVGDLKIYRKILTFLLDEIDKNFISDFGGIKYFHYEIWTSIKEETKFLEMFEIVKEASYLPILCIAINCTGETSNLSKVYALCQLRANDSEFQNELRTIFLRLFEIFICCWYTYDSLVPIWRSIFSEDEKKYVCKYYFKQKENKAIISNISLYELIEAEFSKSFDDAEKFFRRLVRDEHEEYIKRCKCKCSESEIAKIFLTGKFHHQYDEYLHDYNP